MKAEIKQFAKGLFYVSDEPSLTQILLGLSATVSLSIIAINSIIHFNNQEQIVDVCKQILQMTIGVKTADKIIGGVRASVYDSPKGEPPIMKKNMEAKE